jgi:uncharacterized protein YjdB
LAWIATAFFVAACGGAADGITTPTVDPNRPGAPATLESPAPDVNLTAVGSSSLISIVAKDARGTIVPNPTVTWSSVDITVADVAGSGTTAVVTARAPGRTLVRARVGVLVQDFAVTVVGARGITLSPSTASMRAGDRLTLTPVLDADSGARVDIRYTTEQPAIVTVATNGEVTGMAPGVATVRATVVGDPRLNAVALITVTPARSVRIQGDSITTWVNDRTVLRTVVDVDSGQSPTVLWRSDNPSIATVSATGELVATGVGRARIRATLSVDAKATDSLNVSVLPERKVEITPSTVSMGAGQTRSLSAAVSIESGLSRAVIWRSANAAVAMVSSDGLVTGVSQGTTQITAIAAADTTRRATAVVQIVPVARDIDLQPSAASIFMGDSRQLTAAVTVDTGGTAAVSWRTSNPGVASVSNSGLVTGIAAGTAIITAVSQQDTTLRATSLITVRNAIVVAVSPASVTFNPGETRSLSVSVRADAGVSTAVSWRIDDPTVATIDASGRLTAVAAGSTVATAVSLADTTRRGRATVLVVPAIRSVTVSPTTLSLAPTESQTLSAAVTGDPGASQAVVWRSSDPTTVSVSGTGVVTGVRIGSATITALAAGDTTKRATALVSVRNAPLVTVSPTSFSLQTGQTRTVTATVSADNGVSTAVTWTSSNPAVATVNSSGLVTAVGIGSATITATSVADGTRSASATVSVVPQVLGVTVTPSSASLAVGGSTTLSATVSAQGGLTTAVTWRSSNPSVASVNFAGAVSAIATGTATITALSQADTTKRASATITVSALPPRLAASWSSTRLGGALYEDVVSIDGIDASNAFAVNSVGNVYRWTGSAWALSAAGSTFGTQFLAVHGSSANNVIAVGTNGVIAQFNGSSWTAMTSGSTATLNGIWVESASSAFAVGASGVALRFNGSSWSATSTGTTQSLNAVWASSGTAYAVGSSGAALRWNGSAWTVLSTGTTETLYGVSGTSASDVTAVGTFGTVLRFNGSAWTKVTTSVTADLYGVAVGSATYIASDNGVLQLSGSALTTVTTPYAPRMFAVNTDAAGGVWASGQRGLAMRLSGSWTTTNLAGDLIDVWSVSSSRAWAVGEFGSVYQWNGSGWTRQATPVTSTLNAVWGASASEAFAGGDNGVMLRWDGASWTTQSFPSSSAIYGIWGTSSSNVYAVTSGGQIVRYNGSSWSTVATASAALWAIHGSSATDIVATGENGSGMRFNGSSWVSFNAATTGTLAGVFALAPSSYLSVGANSTGNAGLAFLGTPSGWNATSTSSTRLLTSVWGPSGTDVYATGEAGTILRYNGSAWTTMSSGTTDLLWSVSGASDATAGFAVGYNSTIVTATPGVGLVAGLRVGGAALSPSSLEPQRGAVHVRGALPEGKDRKARKLR